LLGIERELLLKRPFINFIAEATDRDIFINTARKLFKNRSTSRAKSGLRKKTVWRSMRNSKHSNGKYRRKAGSMCMTITDIADRRRIDDAIKFQVDVLSQVSDAVVGLITTTG